MHISSVQARAILDAGEARAKEMGVPVNIAVLDGGGHLKAFLRMDDAMLGCIDIALTKARTSALFGKNTEALGELCKPGGPFPGLELTNGTLVIFPGGLPILSKDGTLHGAVGVSGGTSLQDAEIAQAAVQEFDS